MSIKFCFHFLVDYFDFIFLYFFYDLRENIVKINGDFWAVSYFNIIDNDDHEVNFNDLKFGCKQMEQFWKAS